MKKFKVKGKKKFDSYPLSDWLAYCMEENIGRQPVWNFPNIPPSKSGFFYHQLDFRNRYAVLDMFKNDPDTWVDKRFKKPKKLYQYVANLRINGLYNRGGGACDWIVWKDDAPIGLLHSFGFSKKNKGLLNRQCSIGFAFVNDVRGTGLPFKAVQHFTQQLFKKLNLLYISVSIEPNNERSIGFARKLGFVENVNYEEGEFLTDSYWDVATSSPKKKKKKVKAPRVFLDLFRSKRTETKVLEQRKKDWEAYKDYIIQLRQEEIENWPMLDY